MLAALALPADKFPQLMEAADAANPPAFYSEYVKFIQADIQRNAELEFEALWREGKRTGSPFCQLTNDLSARINQLGLEVQQSNLWKDANIRRKVLEAVRVSRKSGRGSNLMFCAPLALAATGSAPAPCEDRGRPGRRARARA